MKEFVLIDIDYTNCKKSNNQSWAKQDFINVFLILCFSKKEDNNNKYF